MTEKAARALVARRAAKLREAIHGLQAHETDPIVHHRLAEVNAECAWVERQYGTAKAKKENGSGGEKMPCKICKRDRKFCWSCKLGWHKRNTMERIYSIESRKAKRKGAAK